MSIMTEKSIECNSSASDSPGRPLVPLRLSEIMLKISSDTYVGLLVAIIKVNYKLSRSCTYK